MTNNNVNDTVALLQRLTPWFANLPTHLTQAIAAICRHHTMEGGETIAEEGKAVENIYIVLGGSIKIYALSENGSELVISLQSRGSIFGLISVLDGLGAPHWASARGRTSCLVIPKDNFTKLISENSDIYPHLVELLCNRYRTMTHRFELMSFTSVRDQLKDRILSIFRSENTHPNTSEGVELSIGQSELASMISASRQKVNKELKLLESEGAINLRYKKIIIRDLKKLNQQKI